ncbi:MAG TPA: hypothetical protein VIY90_22550 [Steroidobacteraceae bacterium]
MGHWNFMTTEVVIKGGVIILDKRGRAPRSALSGICQRKRGLTTK